MNSEAIDWAFDQVVGNSKDKLVLIAIARRANKYWAAFPGRAELARKSEVAEVSIPKCLKRLEDNGFLIRVAFAATNGQDQKTGYVLAGCGRPLGELDAAFLALAFADRKQPGVPLAAKPQHWSGGRTGEGRQPATLPGSPRSDPEGRQPATPRRKEHTEDQIEQEGTFGEAAVPAAHQKDQMQAAIAEVRAGAPTPNGGHQVAAAATIPVQRQPRDRRSPIQRRDDDWQAQIASAGYGALQDAIGEYEEIGGKLWKWAQDTAGLDMGVVPGFEWEGREEEQYRAAYLWLLKKHAGDDDWLGVLMKPLDPDIGAPEPDYQWIGYCTTPAGMTDEDFADQMCQAVRGMTEEQWGPQVAEIRQARPGIWWQCRQKAKEGLRERKRPVKLVAMNVVAIQFGILHYRDQGNGRWPEAFVPQSMRAASLAR